MSLSLIIILTLTQSIISSSARNVNRPQRRSEWFRPSFNSTFIYDLDNQPISAPVIVTKNGLSLNEEIYIVDLEGTTAEQIANYHSQNKKVICYFSAGSWEPVRSDALTFLPQCYCGSTSTSSGTVTVIPSDKSTGRCTGPDASTNKLVGWDEWWLDIRSGGECLSNVEDVMRGRIGSAKGKGCDGVDPDNVDVFSNKQTFGVTPQDSVNYLLWLSNLTHSMGMTIDLKNAGDLLVDSKTGQSTEWQSSLVDAFDFNVIESCHQYSECSKYDSFLSSGKPQIQIEYSSSLKTCPTLSSGQKLLVYSGTNLDSNQVVVDCQNGIGTSSASSTTSASTSSRVTGSVASMGAVTSGGTRVYPSFGMALLSFITLLCFSVN